MKVQLFSPYDRQQEVIQATEDPKINYIVVPAGRQTGKTLLAQNLAIKWAISDANKNVMYVTPTALQAKRNYNEVRDYLLPIKVIYSKCGVKGATEIVLKNGSKILFRSADAVDTLRGYRNDYLVLDECGYIPQSTVEEILIPSMNAVKNPKALLIGSPTDVKWFKNYSVKTNPIYKTIRIPLFDNPNIDIPFVLDWIKQLDPTQFKRDVLGMF